MSTDRQAMFVAVIKAAEENPDDDTARLVYADLIQGDGDDELAALIRRGVLCRCTSDESPVVHCAWCAGKCFVERCQHEGCRVRGEPCYLPAGEDAEDQIDGFYCRRHASAHGFCPSCGAFWGGVRSFEATGLCDHCRDELEREDDEADEFPDYEDEYFEGR